jgi:hypothetical protein
MFSLLKKIFQGKKPIEPAQEITSELLLCDEVAQYVKPQYTITDNGNFYTLSNSEGIGLCTGPKSGIDAYIKRNKINENQVVIN